MYPGIWPWKNVRIILVAHVSYCIAKVLILLDRIYTEKYTVIDSLKQFRVAFLVTVCCKRVLL